MSSTAVFAAVEQPDVAALDWGGVTFRCYVYRRPRLKRIEATIFVEQEDGQAVQVWTGTVRQPPTGTFSQDSFPDCPRVIARRNLFVCHWLEEGEQVGDPIATSVQIGRATFDVTSIGSGWTFVGLQDSTHPSRLYDVAPVRGHADDFVVTWRWWNIPHDIVTARYTTGYDWSADRPWLSQNTATNVQDRLLAIDADDGIGDVVYVWQRDQGPGTGHRLWAGRVNASNGLSYGESVLSIDLDSGDNQFYAAGIVRMESSGVEFCVVYEFRPTTSFGGGLHPFQRGIGWTTFRGDTAVKQDPTHWCWNLHLVSRPWTWAAGYALGLNVLCVVSFKSQRIFAEWDQSYGYVVDLDRLQWSESAGTVRPKPVDAIMAGSFDGRPTGHIPGPHTNGSPTANENNGATKRMNHLSSVSPPPLYQLGPDRKTVVVAALAWQRLFTRDPGFDLLENPNRPPATLEPAVAAVRGVRHYHEDPWVLVRDEKEPSAHPTRNYKGAHHRPIALPTEIAGALVFGGGVTQVFDGANLVELGFLWIPEIVAGSAAAGGPEDYHYCVTATWTDKQGQMHRGPPNGPVTIGAALTFDDGNNTAISLTVRQLNLSMKDNRLHYPEGAPVNIEVWRTYIPSGANGLAAEVHEVNGKGITTYLFRRCWTSDTAQPLDDTPINDPTAWAQVITDEALDEDIETAELLPWQLNTQTLQWVPAIPTSHMPLSVCTTWQNRLIGVNPEDPREVVYSNEILPYGTQYVMPEFIDESRYRFDGLGEITGMQGMDEGLVILTRDGVYVLVGEGVDMLGLNATLDLRVVAQGTGCIEPRSVVLAPPGVFFQSDKGYYLVNRSLQLDYATAGAAIEDLIRAGGNVRGATLLRDRNQIRLALNAAPLDTSPATIQPIAAIYDYDHRLWATAYLQRLFNPLTTNPRLSEMQGATWWRGIQGETLHVVLEQGGLAVERASDDTVFADDDWTTQVPIPTDITVEWLHIAGITGATHVNSIGIQTEKLDDVQLTIELWYDRNGDYDDSGAPDDTFTDQSARGYVRIRPTVRKFSAVLIRIYESGDGSGGGVPLTENIKITGLTLEVGRYKGPRRVPDVQIGT